MFQQWLVALLALGGVLGNLLPGDLGRGTHHQLPHPHHHPPGHHAGDHHHIEQSIEHTHGKELGHQDHSVNHHDGEHTKKGSNLEEERRGRQDEEGFVGQLIDFSSAVDDPSTGLKCVLEEATVDTFEKEQLLTCTHSMIQVLESQSLSLPNLYLFLFPTGLPLHLRHPVPASPSGGVQRVLREDLFHRVLREGHQRDGEEVLQAGRQSLQRERAGGLPDRLRVVLHDQVHGEGARGEVGRGDKLREAARRDLRRWMLLCGGGGGMP